MRQKTFIKRLEEKNGGYRIDKFSLDRILMNYIVYPELFKQQEYFISELLFERFKGCAAASKETTDLICLNTFGLSSPRFDSNEFKNIQNETDVLRTFSELAFEWFDENLFDLSYSATRRAYKYRDRKKAKQRDKKTDRRINSQLWIPKKESNSTGEFKSEHLKGVRHGQKLDFFSKVIHRSSRILEPNLDELLTMLNPEINFGDSKLSTETKKKLLKSNFNQYVYRYKKASTEFLQEALKQGEDIFDILGDKSFVEDYVSKEYDVNSFIDSFVRLNIVDSGRSTIIAEQEVIECMPIIIDDMKKANLIDLIDIKCENFTNPIYDENKNISYEKDGALVYVFKGRTNNSTYGEIRFLTPELQIEATLGINAHTNMERKNSIYLNSKLSLPQSRTLQFQNNLLPLANTYYQRYNLPR